MQLLVVTLYFFTDSQLTQSTWHLFTNTGSGSTNWRRAETNPVLLFL